MDAAELYNVCLFISFQRESEVNYRLSELSTAKALYGFIKQLKFMAIVVIISWVTVGEVKASKRKRVRKSLLP